MFLSLMKEKNSDRIVHVIVTEVILSWQQEIHQNQVRVSQLII